MTALELYFELLEVGKDLPKLREFFSNPGNFEQQSVSRLDHLSSIPRSSSQATLDSLDFTRYSEDGERGVDERVAVLEFELRKAKETISSLRANLTDATTEVEESSDTFPKTSSTCDPIKPHEKRCLNFLINEYLLLHNYKLTSITFADENEDQDFEDWDDVGLNMSKPAELVQLYRDGLKSMGSSGENLCEQCCQTEDEEEESSLLVEELAEMSGKISSLELERDELRVEVESLRSSTLRHHQTAQSPVSPLRQPTSNIDEPDRVASELASAIESDRDSVSFGDDRLHSVTHNEDQSESVLACHSSERMDSVNTDRSKDLGIESSSIDSRHIDSGGGGGGLPNSPGIELGGSGEGLDRHSSHFGEEEEEISDPNQQDRFELIGGESTRGGHTSTNGSQDRLSLDVGGDDHSSINDNDWTRVSYTPSSNLANTTSPNDDVIPSCALIQRNFPEAFHKEILSQCYLSAQHVHPLCKELDAIEGELNYAILLDLVTKTVIHQSKNDDLFPLLLATILLHSDPTQRDTLIQILFNTKKRPNEGERKIIVAGLHSILKLSPTQVESCLLAPLWEQIGSKYLERRLLVTDICSALSPHVTTGSRVSYVLPILQQLLLDDREVSVRTAVVRSLTLTISLISDVDKYIQCEELVMTGLHDACRDVVDATSHLLLPVLAKWSLDLRRLQSHFLTKLMQLISSQIKKTSEQDSSTSNLSSSSQKWELRACASLQALTSLLPYLVIFVASSPVVLSRLTSAPDLPPARPRPHFAPLCKGLFNPSVFYVEAPVPSVMRVFDWLIESTNERPEQEKWEEMAWLKDTFLPQLLDLTERLSPSLHPTLTSCLIDCFRSFCAGFGPSLTGSLVRALFTSRIERLEQSLANVSQSEWGAMTLLPVYVLAVLVELPDVQEELQSLLKHFMFSLALCGAPTESLSYTIRELSRFSQHQDTVIAALWEGVVHVRSVVRVLTAYLLGETISQVSLSLLTTKIVPALVTLSSDPDVTVKTATIPVFGSLLLNQTKKEVQDKTYFQLQTFLSDESLLENHAAQVTLIATLGRIAPASLSWFREDAIAPQLCSWASSLPLLLSSTRKQDVLLALLDAYSNVLYTSLSPNTINLYMLPGLRHLESPCSELAPGQLETLRGMIKEAESRAGPSRPPPAPTTPLQSKTSSSVQKINKILSPLQTGNLFSRKKN
uniref:LisH domain and HEAT repeat-containing protein KIAA1468 n=1 Tax=Cacopsylla melanoneura TaxID=428564 RepID=A0A8D9A3M2_9HEMI